MTETAYPLQWPEGRPRVPANRRQFSRFKTGKRQAFAEMVAEVGRMGGKGLVVSSNAPLRRDGTPYSDALDDRLEDPGVAVYFERKGQRVCFSCDTYVFPWENMRAIGKTIEAMRSISRWGAEELLDRAFTGFAQIEGSVPWWSVLGVPQSAPVEAIQSAYRTEARKASTAGDQGRLQALNVARDEAMKAMAAA